MVEPAPGERPSESVVGVGGALPVCAVVAHAAEGMLTRPAADHGE
jgi:hypothetical protein